MTLQRLRDVIALHEMADIILDRYQHLLRRIQRSKAQAALHLPQQAQQPG